MVVKIFMEKMTRSRKRKRTMMMLRVPPPRKSFVLEKRS
jgi:hypothetical protein